LKCREVQVILCRYFNRNEQFGGSNIDDNEQHRDETYIKGELFFLKTMMFLMKIIKNDHFSQYKNVK